MKILMASSEVHPFSKTGGLADMVGALSKTLAALGHEVGVLTPLYRGLRERFPAMERVDWALRLPLGGQMIEATLWKLPLGQTETIYFVDQPEFFDRAGLYGEAGDAFADNAERFLFFSKCAAYMACHFPWQADVLHLHDWHTAPTALLVNHHKWREGLRTAPRVCLTLHNVAYQGQFIGNTFGLLNLPWDYFHADGAEFYGGFNFLKAGIVYADLLTTVSPRYAREITLDLGHGMEGVLRKRAAALTGILNGVDYGEWRTEDNPHLPHPFNATNLRGKSRNKLALQKELGLPVEPGTPIFASVTRLAEQKGMDILLPALEEMLAAHEMQFVLLGSGDPAIEQSFRVLAERFPTKVVAQIGYDTRLSHRIEAGSDFFLMPSRYEPCGLNQMYSLRYGAIPIVRRTGGLDDSVVDFNDDPLHANGVKFDELTAPALANAIRKALRIYADKELLNLLRRRGMTADFSWEQSAHEYLSVFQSPTV
ncbi:MAG: glycogen synthase GlgA [Pedosphaera sp.]|nr:glycogen synthase GlgA [Pedosphaera sp.]